ncbi:hypothetical protein EV424DRAFT_1538567 [Suillus variegatus]|nr:hypothetical protein EV424DRAFT_1538567 [Suillus variegatus]
MDVGHLFNAIKKQPSLACITYVDLASFIRHASLLKNDILQPQPQHISVSHAPDVLPDSVTMFLATSLDMSSDTVDNLWYIVKDLVWELPMSAETSAEDEVAFKIHGHKLGLGTVPTHRIMIVILIQLMVERTLYLPVKTCMNPDCTAWQHGTLLKKEEQHWIVVFTHSEGAKPAWTVHLKCRECNTNYQFNYSIKDQFRTYYSSIPQHIQVSDHQFVELNLAIHWMDLMQIAVALELALSLVSATNCGHLYGIAQTCRTHNDANHWQFGSVIMTEQVWDCFVILALLDDHQLRGERLVVPHDGNQKNCLTEAMYACNAHIVLQGQEELPHTCFGCMRILEMPDGTLRRTEVIVTDGVTLGRPCCTVARCKNALESNRHRFCAAEHRHLESVCAVDGCSQPVMLVGADGKTHKSCNDLVHLRMEAANVESSCSGKSRTQRQRLAKLNDSVMMHNVPPPIVTYAEEDVPLQDVEEWYEYDKVSGAVHFRQAPTTTFTGVLDVNGCSAKDIPSKIKATFRCQHTNNEQLIVRPCGIISGRGTMYHHEAVSNVLIMVKKMFSLPRACKPQHLIYDSNCNALREVESRKIVFFEGMGMCVDAFHHKTKHKASDVFCRERCDMKAYPELLDDDGKYYFNSSIAEQTNVWFGSFHNIC